jgi:hypothetical protein
MLSKNKPLYFEILDNKYFITTINKKQYKLCCDTLHLYLCELTDNTYNDEILILDM